MWGSGRVIGSVCLCVGGYCVLFDKFLDCFGCFFLSLLYGLALWLIDLNRSASLFCRMLRYLEIVRHKSIQLMWTRFQVRTLHK